jgi:hypothetical protein
VVSLLRLGTQTPALGPEVQILRAASGYDAAAQLLLGPVSALLVDLSRLTPAHAGLLQLARRLEVPVVAFGAVGGALDGAVLASVRLVPAEQVPSALQTLLAENEQAQELPDAQAEDLPSAQIQPMSETELAAEEAEIVDAPAPAAPLPQATTTPASAPAPAPRKPRYVPQAAENPPLRMLSSKELDTLLGGNS